MSFAGIKPFLASFVVLAVSLSFASSVHAQDLLVGEYVNNTIWRIAPDGAKTVYAQPAGSGVTRLTGFAFDTAGNLYAARAVAFNPGSSENGVIKVSPNGVVANFATSISGQPGSVAFDSAGNLYVGGLSAGNVRRFSPTGTDLGNFVTASGDSESLAFDVSGNLYVLNETNNQINRFSPTGASLGVFAAVSSPFSLAFDTSGNLYVGTRGGAINRFSPTGTSLGTFATVVGAAFGGLAFAPNGDLYATNFQFPNGGDVRRFSATGTPLGTVSSGINAPLGIAFVRGASASAPEPGSLVLIIVPSLLAAGRVMCRRSR
jgi:streptogramin lyase